MKLERIKGVIMQNFLYLLVFYAIYFVSVPMILYFKDTICGIDILTTFCATIPSGTTGMMNFLLFVLVPILAAIWTIISSTTPQYERVQ